MPIKLFIVEVLYKVTILPETGFGGVLVFNWYVGAPLVSKTPNPLVAS